MGMEQHVENIVKHCSYLIKNDGITYDDMSDIEEQAESPEDLFFKELTMHLARLRYKGLITYVDQFNEFLGQHPKIARAMEAIDARYAGRRVEREQEREGYRMVLNGNHACLTDFVIRQTKRRGAH
jgi:hypothetical protein